MHPLRIQLEKEGFQDVLVEQCLELVVLFRDKAVKRNV